MGCEGMLAQPARRAWVDGYESVYSLTAFKKGAAYPQGLGVRVSDSGNPSTHPPSYPHALTGQRGLQPGGCVGDRDPRRRRFGSPLRRTG